MRFQIRHLYWILTGLTFAVQQLQVTLAADHYRDAKLCWHHHRDLCLIRTKPTVMLSLHFQFSSCCLYMWYTVRPARGPGTTVSQFLLPVDSSLTECVFLKFVYALAKLWDEVQQMYFPEISLPPSFSNFSLRQTLRRVSLVSLIIKTRRTAQRSATITDTMTRRRSTLDKIW